MTNCLAIFFFCVEMDNFTITITDIRIWNKPVGHIIYKEFGVPSYVIFEMPFILLHSLSPILQHTSRKFLSYHSLLRYLTERQLSGISGLMAILSSCFFFLFHLNDNSFVQLLDSFFLFLSISLWLPRCLSCDRVSLRLLLSFHCFFFNCRVTPVFRLTTLQFYFIFFSFSVYLDR